MTGGCKLTQSQLDALVAITSTRSPRMQQALAAVMVDGQTHQQAADAAQIPRPNVTRQVQRMRRLLELCGKAAGCD